MTISNFYFSFEVQASKTKYVILYKGKEITVKRPTNPNTKQRVLLSHILDNLQWYCNTDKSRMKTTLTPSEKKFLDYVLELGGIAKELETFFNCEDFSYKTLMKEAIFNKEF